MKMIKAVWPFIHHFEADEFSEPGQMEFELIIRLDYARELAGVPFQITSSFRKNDSGAHGEGAAVDLRCHASDARLKIVSGLIQAGFNRIGVYNLHVHADISGTRPASVMWVGVSE